MGNTPNTLKQPVSEEDLEPPSPSGSASPYLGVTLPPRKLPLSEGSLDGGDTGGSVDDTLVNLLTSRHVDEVSARLQTASLADHTTGETSVPQTSVPAELPLLPTVFRWEGGGHDVCITGTFNKWTTRIPMVKSKRNFYTIIDLPQGAHQYKFVVDGQWKVDSTQIHEPTVSNDFGTQNNFIEVKESDFDVLNALSFDIANSRGNRGASFRGGGSETSDPEACDTPPGSYGRYVPTGPYDFHLRDFMPTSKLGDSLETPPLLPPQLLQVILNKDTDAHCDPNLLPSPHHVMVNHLYALSIKDGVIVLSVISRYRHKFVSTLFYKPIQS